jgi:hypothetical protein
MIRDPTHGMSVIIMHTIMKSRRIRPHEMSGRHGGGGVVVKEGATGNPLSMIMTTQSTV